MLVLVDQMIVSVHIGEDMKAINHCIVIDKIKDEPTDVGGLIITE